MELRICLRERSNLHVKLGGLAGSWQTPDAGDPTARRILPREPMPQEPELEK